MKYSDMHTHGCYSDGKGNFSDFVESADEKGIISLGFSDHSPVPIENVWSMKKTSLEEYFNEIKLIKINASKNTNIYAGMELDYIPGIDVKKYIDFDNLPLDYFIGSVHYIYSNVLDKYLEVDGPSDQFEILVKEGFEGKGKDLYKAYYNNVREMICTYAPVVAAHIDLITKNNKENIYFDTGSSAYLAEVEKTLDTVKLYGTIIEINTGGMSRGYMDRPYPSDYILDKCIEKEIPVMLNSDAHSPNALAYEFDNIIEYIKKRGFKEVIVYKKGNWTPVQL
ncbi:MAG: histidinol-phosphatase [Clostridiales bacterium]|nr:histidinol-phosphatase [Clostridiales bacterium]